MPDYPGCVAVLTTPLAVLLPWRPDPATRAAFPPPFRLAVATVLRQLGPQKNVACAVRKDPVTGETEDCDLLQEFIWESGMIDCDWFTTEPGRRVRSWAADDGWRWTHVGQDGGVTVAADDADAASTPSLRSEAGEASAKRARH